MSVVIAMFDTLVNEVKEQLNVCGTEMYETISAEICYVRECSQFSEIFDCSI